MTSRESLSAISEEGFAKKGKRSRTLPFELEWSFGLNPDVPILNLSNEREACVAYACSHVVIIFDYKRNVASALQGHRNAVRSLSLSSNGKWLMSADFGDDDTLVIWDVGSKLAACTLFKPHAPKKMTAAQISPDAKYVVTVGNSDGQRRRICIWFWTLGKDEADLSYELEDCCNSLVSQEIKKIVFNQDQPKYFACMSDNHIDFFELRGKMGDGGHAGGHAGGNAGGNAGGKDSLSLSHCCPTIVMSDRDEIQSYGTFTASCYLPETKGTRALTGTADGYILLTWNHIYEESEKSTECEGERNRMKTIRLFRCGITVIVPSGSITAVGNAAGRVTFYDNQLNLIYWCGTEDGESDPIRSISFDLFSVSHDSYAEWNGRGNETEFDIVCSCPPYRVGEEMRQSWENGNDLPVDAYCVNCSDNSFKPVTGSKIFNQDRSVIAPPFYIDNFLVCRATGTLIRFDMRNLKYRLLFRDCGTIVSSLAAHPESCHLLVGLTDGSMRLYDYEKRQLILSTECPHLSDFQQAIEERCMRRCSGDGEMTNDGTAVYVSRLEEYDNFRAVTALTYSPTCDMVACGMENGALWPLHPVTLEPLESIPYKHSEDSLIKCIGFDSCATYMAYTDEARTVAVFRRNVSNEREARSGDNDAAAEITVIMWQFMGKVRAHSSPIRELLFGPTIPLEASRAPRLLTLGEDRELVEYDIENSGPYPYPGLIIRRVDKIESRAVPLCLAWYPPFDAETFLVTASSEYKYRLLNDTTMTIRRTFLGPTFDTPVQRLQMLTRVWRQQLRRQDKGKRAYAIFVTEKTIGIQLLPLDGNPYKAIGIVAHPSKISDVAVSAGDEYVFTVGDCCVLQWKINLRSVDVITRQGGNGLTPYYCLIDGGKEGWLANEMKDLFCYAQILHQGENAISTRIVSDKVPATQIPNLMRAVGYYPSNNELENMLIEISYRHYATTGQLVQEITFEDWVKLYVNHRPAFGLLVRDVRDAFCTFIPDRSQCKLDDNASMTREDFLNILCGGDDSGGNDSGNNSCRVTGEPLTAEEAYTYLNILVTSSASLLSLPSSTSLTSFTSSASSAKGNMNARDHFGEQLEQQNIFPATFQFLPSRISYKDFVTNIMGLVANFEEMTAIEGLKTIDA